MYTIGIPNTRSRVTESSRNKSRLREANLALLKTSVRWMVMASFVVRKLFLPVAYLVQVSTALISTKHTKQTYTTLTIIHTPSSRKPDNLNFPISMLAHLPQPRNPKHLRRPVIQQPSCPRINRRLARLISCLFQEWNKCCATCPPQILVNVFAMLTRCALAC
jgi:hypothetical protein